MPTSQTLSVDCNAWTKPSFNNEISTLLAQELKERPHQETPFAVELHENNPTGGNKSPINNLPNELLTSIFQFGVNLEYDELEERNCDYNELDVDDDDEDTAVDSTGYDEILDFQVLVSHVCRSWRSLALSTSDLWTILSFARNPKVEKAKEYIIRSKDLPLTINFESYSSGFGSPRQEYSQLSRILDLIEPEVSRWRAFTYRRRPKSEIHMLMSRLHEMPEARLLESFRILYSRRYVYRPYPEDNLSYLPFHGHVPYLKEVVFWGVPIDWDSALPNSFRGLRKLELSQLYANLEPSYATIFQLIKNATELHTLTLYFASSILPDNLDFLTIPSLRELHLQTLKPENVTTLVGRLNLPNLHTLGLELWASRDLSIIIRALSSWSNGQKQGLLQSISCLRISGSSCDIATSTELLTQLVALKTLRIESSDFLKAETVFERLTMPVATGSNSSDGFFCPNLEELVVSSCGSGKKLMALISARRKAGVPLKKIGIGENYMMIQDLMWIRENVEHLVLG